MYSLCIFCESLTGRGNHGSVLLGEVGLAVPVSVSNVLEDHLRSDGDRSNGEESLEFSGVGSGGLGVDFGPQLSPMRGASTRRGILSSGIA